MANSLLALIDDIASLLDDVAVMTKIATKKTAGVLGDDLALNAQQVAGVKPDREIPVVLAVAKGSFINKLILVPIALIISIFAPWLITPMLMLGGAFLCFEGVEKLAHKFLHNAEDEKHKMREALRDQNIDLVAFEKAKIKGAIRTDFILSAEIIVITLGTVATATFAGQVAVLAIIAIAMTIGVYGVVAGIVKLDDFGLYLSRRTTPFIQTIGNSIVKSAPYLMKGLSIVGTAAMFMVGGGILTHGINSVHRAIEDITHMAEAIPNVGTVLGGMTPTLLNLVFGIFAGAIVLIAVMAFSKIKNTLFKSV